MPRLLVIGLDAADLDWIDPLIADGVLPNIGRLLTNGSYGPMRSTMPIMSPPAWTTIITGMNPGKHGIYDFFRRLPGSYRLISTRRDQTSFQTIFDHASANGRRVIAMNVPMTYPPKPVNGIMVTGLWTPDSARYTYPDALRDELVSWGYRINTIEFEPGREQEWLDDMWHVTRVQTESMCRLLRREPWDLAMIVYRAIDEVEAFFWKYCDPSHPQYDPVAASRFGSAVRDSYILMDAMVGQLQEAVGSDTIIALVSDHGGGAFHKQVYLNVWLEQQGFLHRRVQHASEICYKGVMRRLGLTRERLAPLLNFPLANRIRQRVPLTVQHALVPEANVTMADVVDWSRTRAYSFGNIGQIYVNLKGREPQGIVEPGPEYEALLDDLTSRLYELTDEGKPVVDEVHRRTDLYHGPYAEYGPDLNVIMRGLTYATEDGQSMTATQVFADSHHYISGIHRPLGIIAFSGVGVPPGGIQTEVQIVDFAPTVMWLLDMPVPIIMDGRVLTEFFSTHTEPTYAGEQLSNERAEIQQGTWASPEEEAEVLKRLRNLGYLE